MTSRCPGLAGRRPVASPPPSAAKGRRAGLPDDRARRPTLARPGVRPTGLPWQEPDGGFAAIGPGVGRTDLFEAVDTEGRAEDRRSDFSDVYGDWESVKDAIMHEALLAKFTQHADLRGILLATGEATIVEHTKNDAYWGDGGDGGGKNQLGRILMRVRDELRSKVGAS